MLRGLDDTLVNGWKNFMWLVGNGELDEIWKSNKIDFIPVNGLILIHSFDHFRLYRVFSFFFFFFYLLSQIALSLKKIEKLSQALEIY